MRLTDSEKPDHDQTTALLRVSEGTLRNWDREGKIAAYRNPFNSYRLFKQAGLDALPKKVARSGRQRRIQRRAI